MHETNNGASRRLERLSRLLEGRRARLAATMARPARRVAPITALGRLQRYGYPLALLLATTAVLPTVFSVVWSRRKLLAGSAANAWSLRRLRKRLDVVRFDGSER